MNQQNIIFQRQIEEIEKHCNFWKLNAIFVKAQKNRRISSLLHEKFALQLLNRRSIQQLEAVGWSLDGAIALLDFMRIHYKKWKRKCKTREGDLLLGDLQLNILYGDLDDEQTQNIANQQIINNLNQQILVLQNNLPINNQHTGMAEYEPPKFHGRAGEDPEVFLTDFQ